MHAESRLWALLMAAGSGSRMGGEVPKQYLPLAGRTVIEHTVERLGSYPGLSGMMVVLGQPDRHWVSIEPGLRRSLPVPLSSTAGGSERCDSVRNGLRALAAMAAPDDWVMVHDAARPCLRHADLDALVAALAGHPVGGILALPVVDTMKRGNAAGDITETVSREQLWRAATPQMFRLGALSAALDDARRQGLAVTDDASAMELAGLMPRLVEGHGDNIKITHPADLDLAEVYLRRQQESA